MQILAATTEHNLATVVLFTGALSLLGDMYVISNFAAFRKDLLRAPKYVAHLLFYKSVADFIAVLFLWISANYRTVWTGIASGLCRTQGWIAYFFLMAQHAWLLSIILELTSNSWSVPTLSKYNGFFHVIIWTIALVTTLVTALIYPTNAFDEWGAYCWQPLQYGLLGKMLVYYIPWFIIYGICVYFAVRLTTRYVKTMRAQRHDHAALGHQATAHVIRLERSLKPRSGVFLIFVLTSLFFGLWSVINAIFVMATGGRLNTGLVVMDNIGMTIQGLFNGLLGLYFFSSIRKTNTLRSDGHPTDQSKIFSQDQQADDSFRAGVATFEASRPVQTNDSDAANVVSEPSDSKTHGESSDVATAADKGLVPPSAGESSSRRSSANKAEAKSPSDKKIE